MIKQHEHFLYCTIVQQARMMLLVLAVLALSPGVLSQQVVTPDGPIKGTTETAINGRSYSAYFSIPYAKPPTGSLRFQPPQAVDPWSEVFDASVDRKKICHQLYTDEPEETEDCLILNVYVPQGVAATDLPVLFFIHGGGFIAGSGLENGPDGWISPAFFIANNVVVVTINYRLGVYGFFTSGDQVIPGNNGLKDQVLALKWVQRNIASFGGDPNRVVIIGQSAGSASVGYHLLSPASSGLFSGAILESGTALCPWAYQRNQVNISYKTASFIDAEFEYSRDSQKLLQLLQSVDAATIDAAAHSYTVWDSSSPDAIGRLQLQQGFFFAPVTEVPNDNAFLTQYPYTVLESGNFNKVPILIGTTSEEGLMNMDAYLDYTLNGYDLDLTSLNPRNMHIVDDSVKYQVANALKQEYSPSDTFLNNKLGGIQYFTEQDFTKSIVKFAELYSAGAPTYFYMFSYSGKMGGNTNYHYPGSGNVTHVEEAGYIFSNIDPAWFPEDDQVVHEKLVKIWTNFAIYLNPTPTPDAVLENIVWPKVQPGGFQYVNILKDLIVTQGKPKADRMAFWDNLYETYAIKPYDTY